MQVHASTKKGSLKAHLKIHGRETSNKFKRCEYASFHAYNLTVNLKTHNRKHLYKCNQCKFSSTWPTNLRTHYKMHSAEKLYRCNGATFETLENRRKYKQRQPVLISRIWIVFKKILANIFVFIKPIN